MSKLVLTIEIEILQRPMGIPDFTHEAMVTRHSKGMHKQYFYGHSIEEVLADVLANRLQKKVKP